MYGEINENCIQMLMNLPKLKRAKVQSKKNEENKYKTELIKSNNKS